MLRTRSCSLQNRIQSSPAYWESWSQGTITACSGHPRPVELVVVELTVWDVGLRLLRLRHAVLAAALSDPVLGRRNQAFRRISGSSCARLSSSFSRAFSTAGSTELFGRSPCCDGRRGTKERSSEECVMRRTVLIPAATVESLSEYSGSRRRLLSSAITDSCCVNPLCEIVSVAGENVRTTF